MTDTHNENEIDHVSGIETTGHEWDGIKELNNPAPRWWLWVFYATVIWAVWYWVIFPAWPTISGSTQGTKGWTQYTKLADEQAEIAARQDVYLARFEKASFDQIMNDPELYAFAVAGGASAFKDNCATCHGTGAAGSTGYPNLNDDDWLWGGSIESINQTIHYGVRSGHEKAHTSQMPSFGKDGFLKPEEINQVVDYVVSLSEEQKPDASILPGKAIFSTNCTSCHGEDGKGNREFGAPNLSDAIWLYGNSKDAIYHSIYTAHAGVMPYWEGRLNENTIRELAVYIHSLGGGEKSNSQNEPETNTSVSTNDTAATNARTAD